MTARLALFDLDGTLLAGDSDHAWGEFLIARGLVDEAAHRAENDRHYAAYQAGELDIHAYTAFAVGPLADLGPWRLWMLRRDFMGERVMPMILPAARRLLQTHRDRGDCLVIITATNAFTTTPIARQLGVKHLLATELERRWGGFTGTIRGTPCYGPGKVVRLRQWLQSFSSPRARSIDYSLEKAVFYTDSINDMPLLEKVGEPVAVDPDPALGQEASKRGWKICSLRTDPSGY